MEEGRPRTIDRRRAKRYRSGVAVRVRAVKPYSMPEQVALMTDVSETGACLEFHHLEALAACVLGDTMSVEGRIRNLARSLGHRLEIVPLGQDELATRVNIARIQLGDRPSMSYIGVSFERTLASPVRTAFGLK